MKYVLYKHGANHFRRRVPDDLREIIGAQYIWRVLRRPRSEQESEVHQHLAETSELFLRVRMEHGLPTPERGGQNRKVPLLSSTAPALVPMIPQAQRPERSITVEEFEVIDKKPLRTELIVPTDPKPVVQGYLEFEGQKSTTLPTLDYALTLYLQKRKVRPKTKVAWERTVKLFNQVVGRKLIRDITRQDVLKYLDWMEGSGTTHDGQVTTIVTGQQKRLAPKSIAKNIAAICAILNFCVARNLIDKNVALNVQVEGGNNAETERAVFSDDELRHIFRHPDLPDPTWIPWIGLYEGATLNEIIQLRVSDVQRRGDIWFFSFNEADGKTIKNAIRVREVPVHPALIKGGFLKYVDKRRKAGAETLFEIKDEKGKEAKSPSDTYSKRFNHSRKSSFLRKLGYQSQRHVFHSFRHGFKAACRDAGVGIEIHDRLTGHKTPGVGSGYGTGNGHSIPLKVLQAEISKIKFPVAP